MQTSVFFENSQNIAANPYQSVYFGQSIQCDETGRKNANKSMIQENIPIRNMSILKTYNNEYTNNSARS